MPAAFSGKVKLTNSEITAMKKPFIFAAVILSFLLSGSSWAVEPAAKYYPLKEGMTWVYNIVSGKPGTQKITITNLAPTEIKGQKVTPRKWELAGGVKYHLIAIDDSGVYRYAEQTAASAEPKILTPRLYYLKNPVEIGTTWDMEIKTAEEELKINVTIDSTSETVQVPGGTYKDCVKVKHEGGGLLKKDNTHLSVTSFEWYAPGVGPVKTIFTFKRKVEGQPESTETTTYQLESFKP